MKQMLSQITCLLPAIVMLPIYQKQSMPIIQQITILGAQGGILEFTMVDFSKKPSNSAISITGLPTITILVNGGLPATPIPNPSAPPHYFVHGIVNIYT